MTGKELRELVNSGITPLIEFNDKVDEMQLRWEHGMRGYVVAVSEPEFVGSCIRIKIDEQKYIEYNKQMETANWCKENGGEFIYKWSDLNKSNEYEGNYIFYETENEELIHRSQSLQEENKYLKAHLKECEAKTCNEIVDGTNYKEEYKKVRKQLSDAINTIKFLSNLLY